MKYNDLINELLELLDKDENIIRIKELKKRLLTDEILLQNLENFRINKTISNKIKLYENQDYLEYLKCETNINFLIQDIKNKLKIGRMRKCHENN